MIWKPIPGYEGLYEINGAGEVRSLTRRVPQSGRAQSRRLYSVRGRMLKAHRKGRANGFRCPNCGAPVATTRVILSRDGRQEGFDPQVLAKQIFKISNQK